MSHSHHHKPKNYNRAFAVGVTLNIAFVAIEIVYGLSAGSLALIADAAISFGVVVIGVLILYTGMLWLDPVISIVIVCLILIGTWGLLRDSVSLLIDSVPRNIDPHQVDHYSCLGFTM